MLLTQDKYTEADLKSAQTRMRPLGIELLAVPTPERYARTNEWFVGQSIAVYERLRTLQFDVVHFPENLGNGYYSVLAKKLGLDFQNTTFVAGLHGFIEGLTGPFRSGEGLLPLFLGADQAGQENQ